MKYFCKKYHWLDPKPPMDLCENNKKCIRNMFVSVEKDGIVYNSISSADNCLGMDTDAYYKWTAERYGMAKKEEVQEVKQENEVKEIKSDREIQTSVIIEPSK